MKVGRAPAVGIYMGCSCSNIDKVIKCTDIRWSREFGRIFLVGDLCVSQKGPRDYLFTEKYTIFQSSNDKSDLLERYLLFI